MNEATKTAAGRPGNSVCWKCQGSGKFYKGGAVVNGQYTGEVGVCYPCSGKGWQSPADRKRTNYYYAHIYRPAL